jgi:hypothetical protein
MKAPAKGLLGLAGSLLLAACASTNATVDDAPASRPPARVVAPATAPSHLPARDVHSDCAQRAPRKPATDPYDASTVPMLSKTMFYARENYVDPRRLVWSRALLGALTALPHVAPEISVDPGEGELPSSVTIGIAGLACRVPVAAVTEPWEMRSNVMAVMKVVQGSLPPLAAEPAGQRLFALELAATNGMLATFDARSLLMERSAPGQDAAAPASRSLAAPEQILLGSRNVKVGYVRIERLFNDASASVRKALGRFTREGVGGIIVDLRGNKGGLVDQAEKVVDAFATRGVIVSVVGRQGQRVEEARADGTEPTVPVVVLADRETGAGGALVAAGLHDLAGAILLGEPTDAGASLQMVFDFASPLDVAQKGPPLALKLTVAHWRLAGDRSIEGTGVVPDVPIPPRVLALEGAAVAAARDALSSAHTSDRAAVIAAAKAAVRAAEMK